MDVIHKVGRRKTSVARVYLSKGKGKITINKKDFKDYFPTNLLRYKIEQAQSVVDEKGSYDIMVNVFGGGLTGQAEAIRLAIARALVEKNPENNATINMKKQPTLITKNKQQPTRKK